MQGRQNTGARYSAPPAVGASADGAGVARGQGWDARLRAGLAVARVPEEARVALARALGEAGVEAEFFLALLQTFPLGGHSSRPQGEIFLSQLDAAARRICRVAASLEVAAQGYLAGLASGYPELRSVSELDDVWWPPFPDVLLDGEPLELRLRRCGFALRHVAQVHLASSVEAIAERMLLTLHALGTLPPAGIMPARSLYQGLYELSSAWQGDVVQHHILDIAVDSPGVLTAVARLRALDGAEDTSLESDLSWARTQLALVRGTTTSPDIAGHAVYSGGPTSRPRDAVIERAAREWYETISALDQLRQAPDQGPIHGSTPHPTSHP